MCGIYQNGIAHFFYLKDRQSISLSGFLEETIAAKVGIALAKKEMITYNRKRVNVKAGWRRLFMGMVQTERLVYEYEKRDEEGNVIGMSRAIDGVDIDVKEGQFIAILGHHGSGKSTLAKHMNAILVPTEGTMWVDGKDTKDPENLWEVRQSAGMVFQNPDNQIIGTVVEEDVGFGPENLGVPTDEIWSRVEESLKAVGMIEYRHHSPNKLSG